MGLWIHILNHVYIIIISPLRGSFTFDCFSIIIPSLRDLKTERHMMNSYNHFIPSGFENRKTHDE